MKAIRAVHGPGVTVPLSAYSQAVYAGEYLFISGQGPLDVNANLIGADIEEQTEATLCNLQRVVKAAGGTLNDIVKVTVYLKSIGYYDRFNRVYERYFSSPPFPARTCVGAGELWSGVLIEIDATAYVSKERQTSAAGTTDR